MTVLQVCAYSSEYEGNFITSLLCLESLLKNDGIRTIYAFPEEAADRDWCKRIQERTDVFFLPELKARIRPETYHIFGKVYREHDIAIVHTHFELYDIPATIMAKKSTKVFWHLHDPIQIKQNLHGLLWRFQYGVVGRRAELLAVSDYYRNYVVAVGFPKKQTRVILNGIDTSRIQDAEHGKKRIDFLTFGWDYYRKGDDLILQACERLATDGYRFKLLLNGNQNTWNHLPVSYHDNLPEWLELGNHVENVNLLFSVAKCFVQASRRETFSYAICEAAYAGLPVICSRIPGVEWAEKIPTVDFFASEDIDQLYMKMKSFLEEKNYTEADLSETRKVIIDRYSVARWAKTIREYYLENA